MKTGRELALSTRSRRWRMTASEMLKLLKYGCWLAGTSDAFNHRAVFTIEVGLKHGMNVVGAAMLQATFQFSAGQT